MSVAVDSDAEDDAVSEIAEAAGVSPAPRARRPQHPL
ncbi:putative MCE associated membrane protein [Mycobacterium tuberculosis]|uniref:Putative MCE associated membrane protein n=1 Tax=Mycobacterium tuberculosis TaxID=1773 RepID=A0A655J7U6_MYCTX|nr:putative MCE associated membrane protein [Mycobacterium tuberculosis]